MEAIPVVKLDGSKQELTGGQLEELRAGLRGPVLPPGVPGYEEARRIWNATADRCPGLIAQCTGEADVMRALEFAARHDLLVAVRGGGHNIAGNAVCEGGLMIDLSRMRSVRVDPRSRRAHVSGGALLGDVDHETQAFGLATPLGINSTTGIGGLTLGGGFGWLSRQHGLTIDSLRAADVVTADGKALRASAEENPDLFWAIRGGGGNFGVVTRFELQLYPVGPEIFGGLIVYPIEQARGVLEAYRELAPRLPVDLSAWCLLRKAPPLPFLGPEVHGTGIVALPVCYLGDPSQAEKALEPLRRLGKPLGEHLGPVSYQAWQQTFDPLLAAGARNYWKTQNFTELSDGALDTLLSFAERFPSPHCEIFLALLGGKASEVAPEATAYAHRKVLYVMNVHARWETRPEDTPCISWARELFQATTPYASGGGYVNFMTEEEGGRVKEAYGSNYDRLVAVKTRLDPGNRFRLNQNIKPAR